MSNDKRRVTINLRLSGLIQMQCLDIIENCHRLDPKAYEKTWRQAAVAIERARKSSAKKP